MFDTDTSSYIIRRSNERVLERLREVSPQDTCISVLTKCELLYGLEVSPKRLRHAPLVEAFLRYISVRDLTDAVCVHYAELRGILKSSGQMIGANDLLIAAHAKSLGLTLVTNNVREFGRVPGLQVENWAESGG